ncbi:MAG: serine/threonine protein kinase [Myxococcales bacterium]|nr:serine/threonine protein kinase [Myxococcales bacterium]
MTDDHADATTPPSARSGLPSPFSEEGVEEAAIRGRLAARLFGEAPAAARIGRYEVGERIGVGGMGVVYSARDPELGRLVALKVLSSQRSADLKLRERLLGEARTLARLSHPNVVQIYEVGEHQGAIFLALELIEGETMARWQAREGRSWQEILAAYVDAARGLAAAHQVGVVHGDVKPANILVGVDGRVRVADFGLARERGERGATPISEEPALPGPEVTTNPAGAIAGTPAYMAPEQLRGHGVDARSDLFALCLSLFEGLYRVRPFDVDDFRRRRGRPEEPIDSLRRLVPRASQVPGWILPILARGLDPDPGRRFVDVPALIAAIESTPRRRRRRRALATALVGGLIVAALVENLVAAPACPEESDVLVGAWDPQARAVLRERFLASDLPYAEAEFTQVERAIDGAVLALSRERRSSCLRTRVENVQSEELFDLAEVCLKGIERSIRGQLALLGEGGPEVITNAHALVAGVGEPAVCSSVDDLRRGPAPPPSRELRRRVDELRGALADVRDRTLIAEYARAGALADEILAASTIYRPLHAEALLRRAVIDARVGELARADETFAEAAAEAEAVRDDRLAAEILGEQVELANSGLRDVSRARAYAHLYDAKLRRIRAEGRSARSTSIASASSNSATGGRRSHSNVTRKRWRAAALKIAWGGRGASSGSPTRWRSCVASTTLTSATRMPDHPPQRARRVTPASARVTHNLALNLIERPDPARR